jgi:hypothetical protein
MVVDARFSMSCQLVAWDEHLSLDLPMVAPAVQQLGKEGGLCFYVE